MLCHQRDALLIVNDRADVAVASGADGVHVGKQDDLPADRVRAIVGPDLLLGVSASTVDEAVEVDRSGADYLGFGAMFATPTKTDAEYAGPGAACRGEAQRSAAGCRDRRNHGAEPASGAGGGGRSGGRGERRIWRGGPASGGGRVHGRRRGRSRLTARGGSGSITLTVGQGRLWSGVLPCGPTSCRSRCGVL